MIDFLIQILSWAVIGISNGLKWLWKGLYACSRFLWLACAQMLKSSIMVCWIGALCILFTCRMCFYIMGQCWSYVNQVQSMTDGTASTEAVVAAAQACSVLTFVNSLLPVWEFCNLLIAYSSVRLFLMIFRAIKSSVPSMGV